MLQFGIELTGDVLIQIQIIHVVLLSDQP